MIYVFLANGFEEAEALVPVDFLRRAGYSVVTVGIGGTEIEGAHGITVKADISDAKMSLSGELSAVILPGGMPGTLNLKQSAAVKRALDFASERHLVIGAICAAPSVLGHYGLLKGKMAVCYPGFEDELAGAEIPDAVCCISDNIVTAKGAGAVFEFSSALCDLISWQDNKTPFGDFSLSEGIMESIQCAR